MKEYNDYIFITKSYLKNYNQLKITIENLTDEVAAQEKILNDDISKKNTEVAAVDNIIHTADYKRNAIKSRIDDMQINILSIKRTLRKVDRAIEGLSKENKKFIIDYYIKNKSWQEIAIENNYTEKWTRNKGNRAIKEVALMIFGPAAMPDTNIFVFAI